MPLELNPLTESEWPLYMAIQSSAFAPSPVLRLWFPGGLTEAANQHAIEGLKRQSEKYPGRAEFLKVIDTDLPDTDPYGKIVGVSQWRLYPRERSEEEVKQEEADEEADHALYGFPPGSNEEALGAFYKAVGEYQKKHLGRNPYLFLQLLATRAGHNRRGIGAIALKHGCAKADELGVPAYLEGSPEGVGLYKKWGFEVVDQLKVPIDTSKYGPDEAFVTLCMKRQPRRSASAET